MKKIFFVLALAVWVSATSFGLNTKYGISIDAGDSLLGWFQDQFSISGYAEFGFPGYFSILGKAGYTEYLYRGADTVNGYSVWKFGAEGRFYWPFRLPAGEPDNSLAGFPNGLFIGGGAEYWLVSFYEGSLGTFTGGGFIIPLRIGYKWVVWEIDKTGRGLFIEPYFGYQFPVGFKVEDLVLGDRFGGIWAGLNIGFLL